MIYIDSNEEVYDFFNIICFKEAFFFLAGLHGLQDRSPSGMD